MSASWFWGAVAVIWSIYLAVLLDARKHEFRALEPRKMQSGELTVLFHGRTPFWKLWRPMRVNVEIAKGGYIFMTLFNAPVMRAETCAVTALSCAVRLGGAS